MGGTAGLGMQYAINGWAACAPGLVTPAQWQAWARSPALPAGLLEAPLAEMPPMLRRRLGPLGRMAAQVAWHCQQAATGIPLVFASRYGDAERALKLLQEFAVDGAMSPADFTLSVHNAIGALYSIARSDGSPSCSVAAGAASAAAGLTEALALVADGAPEVLLVCYDAPLPGDYAGFADEPACAYAWSWRVAAATPGQPHFSLSWTPCGNEPAVRDGGLPFGLEVLRFALSDAPAATHKAAGRCWTWTRHD